MKPQSPKTFNQICVCCLQCSYWSLFAIVSDLMSPLFLPFYLLGKQFTKDSTQHFNF